MSAEAPPEAIADIAGYLDANARVVVLSGSGMSAESGIPTFRDAQTGLWARFRPEELATPEAFARDPRRVWQWYEHRRAGVRSARPHAGHRALVELERRVARLTIVTQNVDGLHQRSGSSRVLELHGNILRSICSASRRPIDAAWIEAQEQLPPPSPHVAGALARPDVVWFGEALPEAAYMQAIGALQNCTVCIAVGTSALVQPAASLPLVAREAGALLVEINPAPTPLSGSADRCLRQPASAALVALAAARGNGAGGEKL
ncbi:MAG: NAD-dependent protein deacylase [Xanthomonadales bacterium]|nr:NAD-dependent protein deacylase [Xanthomonadales bacterium]NIN59140.1 NAD-dependent protein deacylase [Xanthomonadales bacterium]NIN74451.1 NAD-dependent protein deacylase [Xanthomonadales bacterium]NIO13254.1 NAD-dependent protein deacylase [Xanthomonadales bacterium]NIP11533.1 NAD-dependent protein deacylase [Xanthomonadales bacterium]